MDCHRAFGPWYNFLTVTDMEISFNLDGKHHHGTAVPYGTPGSTETQFVIRLEGAPVFHVNLSADGGWVSNDMDVSSLVNAVGKEIEQRDNGSVEIVANGEIVNEPDDVDEHSFDHP
jgi:hypothetical protein